LKRIAAESALVFSLISYALLTGYKFLVD